MKKILLFSVLVGYHAYGIAGDDGMLGMSERQAHQLQREQARKLAQSERKKTCAQQLVQRKKEQEERARQREMQIAQRKKEQEERQRQKALVVAEQKRARQQAAEQKALQLAERKRQQQEQRALQLAQQERERQEREAQKAMQLVQRKKAQEERAHQREMQMAQRKQEQKERQRQKALVVAEQKQARQQAAEQKALQLAERKRQRQEQRALQLAQQERERQSREAQKAQQLAQRKQGQEERQRQRELQLAQRQKEKEERAEQRAMQVAQRQKEKKDAVEQEKALLTAQVQKSIVPQEATVPLEHKEVMPVAALAQQGDYSGYNERFNRVMAYAEKHLEVTRQLVDTQQRMIQTMRKDLAQLSALAIHEGDVVPLEGDTEQEMQYAFDQFSYHAHLNGQVVDHMLKVLDGECAIVTQLEQNAGGTSLQQKVHERDALLEDSPVAVQRMYEAVMEQAFDAAQEFEGKRKEYLSQMRTTFVEMQQKIRALCQDV